ncbi:hypothetical protein BS638_11115 [Clostridium tepidum]|uniref:Uncharacterized protein n=1 Tax=Clostridium tepidum TaxID=1962263 RepID=A0A1S9I268_9CLOT|nr:hypothetical protein BS638_11115 [Clostridium tepidum]
MVKKGARSRITKEKIFTFLKLTLFKKAFKLLNLFAILFYNFSISLAITSKGYFSHRTYAINLAALF